MIKQTPRSVRAVWACAVMLALFNGSMEAARNFIEFETQRDSANALETFDTQILAVGRLRTQKGNDDARSPFRSRLVFAALSLIA